MNNMSSGYSDFCFAVAGFYPFYGLMREMPNALSRVKTLWLELIFFQQVFIFKIRFARQLLVMVVIQKSVHGK